MNIALRKKKRKEKSQEDFQERFLPDFGFFFFFFHSQIIGSCCHGNLRQDGGSALRFPWNYLSSYRTLPSTDFQLRAKNKKRKLYLQI